MGRIKGPAIFLAQFLREEEPFNTLSGLAKWVADLGYKAVQIPTWDRRTIDLEKAAESQTYCDEYKGLLGQFGLEVSELGAHLQGQVLAIHPAYEMMFEAFHPKGLRGQARTRWATDQLEKAVCASARLGTRTVPVLSGGFAWHMAYP